MRKVMVNDYFVPSFVSGIKDCYLNEGDEIKIESQNKEIIKNGAFTFINLYGFPYYILFDRAEVIFYEANSLSQRVFEAAIYGMKYSIDGINFKTVNSMWGNPDVIEVSDSVVKTKMILPEEQSFMQRICEEIFADG